MSLPHKSAMFYLVEVAKKEVSLITGVPGFWAPNLEVENERLWQ